VRAPRLSSVLAWLAAISVAAPVALGAQTPPDAARADTARTRPDTTPSVLEAVRVTVTRVEEPLRNVPLPVTVVDATRTEEDETGVSLQGALEGVPGVFVADRHNLSLGDRLVVRGAGARAQFGVRGVQVLADGIPLTLPDGQAALGNLDLGSADRIEVVRGPASSLYGNASGGVLRVESGPFPAAPLAPSARLVAGGDGLLQAELRAGGTDGSLSWLFHGTRMRTDGFREHARAERWQANLVARSALAGGGEIRGVLNLYRLPFAQNPGSLDRQTALEAPRTARPFLIRQGTGETSGQGQAGVSAVLPLGGRTRLRGSVWGLARDVWNPIPNRVIDLGRAAGGVRSVLSGRAEPGGLPLLWTAGLDAGLQSDHRRELENLGVPPGGERAAAGALLLDQDERVLQAAPFVRLEARLPGRVGLSAGLRLDAYRFSVADRLLADGDDSDVRWMTSASPSAGVTWSPLPWLGTYARLGTAFETPTTSELSNRPDGGGGFAPDLGPEHTVALEAGARGALGAGRLRWEVAAYRARVTDALVPFQGPGDQTFYRNAGRLTRRGLELRAEARPVPRTEVRLSWALERHAFDRFGAGGRDLAGNLEPGVPGQRAFVSAAVLLPGRLRLEARGRWVDAYPADDANTAWASSHRVVDLRLGGRTGPGGRRLKAFAGVDNLLDERYSGSVVPNAFGGRYYEPAPGRTFLAGVEVGM